MLDRAAATSTAGPALSVVLPNYNHAQYFRARSTRSCHRGGRQTRSSSSTIVLRTAAGTLSRAMPPGILRSASFSNDRNVGVIPTLSRGLGEARGQFVYFGAADDFVLPGFFEAAISMLQSLSAGGAVFWRRKFGGRTIRPLSRRPPAGAAAIFRGLHRCAGGRKAVAPK